MGETKYLGFYEKETVWDQSHITRVKVYMYIHVHVHVHCHVCIIVCVIKVYDDKQLWYSNIIIHDQ